MWEYGEDYYVLIVATSLNLPEYDLECIFKYFHFLEFAMVLKYIYVQEGKGSISGIGICSRTCQLAKGKGWKE